MTVLRGPAARIYRECDAPRALGAMVADLSPEVREEALKTIDELEEERVFFREGERCLALGVASRRRHLAGAPDLTRGDVP